MSDSVVVPKEIEDVMRRVGHAAIAGVGEACKKDLIFLTESLGYSESDAQEKFPEFFEEGGEELVEESYPEIEGEDNDEDETTDEVNEE